MHNWLSGLLMFVSAVLSAPLDPAWPQPWVYILPANPRMSDITDGYRLISNSHTSLVFRSGNREFLIAPEDGIVAVDDKQFQGLYRLGPRSLTLNLDATTETDPVFQFSVLDGPNTLIPAAAVASAAFVVHVGAPSSLRSPDVLEGVPYMVAPSHMSTETESIEFWKQWHLTPSPTQQWYSFNYGNVHVIVLDTAPGNADDLLYWLKLDLKSLDRELYPWVIVAGHDDWADSVRDDTRREINEVFSAQEINFVALGNSAIKPNSWLRFIVNRGDYLVVERVDTFSGDMISRTVLYTDVSSAGRRVMNERKYAGRIVLQR